MEDQEKTDEICWISWLTLQELNFSKKNSNLIHDKIYGIDLGIKPKIFSVAKMN